jgi:hypothetical protein
MTESTGFGQGFHREIEAILSIWDRGGFFLDEFRLNLKKAGVILVDEREVPDIQPPQVRYDDADQYTDGEAA